MLGIIKKDHKRFEWIKRKVFRSNPQNLNSEMPMAPGDCTDREIIDGPQERRNIPTKQKRRPNLRWENFPLEFSILLRKIITKFVVIEY